MNVITDITAAVRRSNQTYFEQTAERVTISCGYAYTRPEYRLLPDCNFVGEILLDDDTPDPVAYVNDYFLKRMTECRRWFPSQQQDPEPVAALVEPLGFERREYIAYGCRDEETGDVDERFRFIGARAMRRAYTSVIEQRSAEFPELADALTTVQLERLDDPRYDGFVALKDDEPVGMIAVYQVGEIGRLCDLFVPGPHRRNGVATALVNYGVQTARRWALRPLCMQIAAHNTAGRALAAKTGFGEDGIIVGFVRPDDAEVGQ